MADTDTQRPENPRKAIREAREARMRVIVGPPKTVTVYAATEALRASLRHATGTRFRETLDQGVEWPNDSFTARRIADGSVLTEPPKGGEPAAPDPAKNPRENAERSQPKSDDPQPQPQPDETQQPQPDEPQPQTDEPKPDASQRRARRQDQQPTT